MTHRAIHRAPLQPPPTGRTGATGQVVLPRRFGAPGSKWLPAVLGASGVLTYFIFNSVIMAQAPGLTAPLWVARYLALAAGLAYIVMFIDRPRLFVNLGVVVILLATVLSATSSVDVMYSLERWAGWALLLLALGPGIDSSTAREVRGAAVKTALVVMFFVVGVSVLTWPLRLDLGGRGVFPGVMSHSMILGPVAMIAALVAMVQFFERPSWRWGYLLLASVACCMLSGSRAAALALVAGVLMQLLLRVTQARGLMIVLSCAIFGFALIVGIGFDRVENVLPEDSRYRLLGRGLDNTRDELWEQRMSEFNSNPLHGVGFGIIAGIDDREAAGVEPGSSYLAILSMTGTIGAVGFAIMFLPLAGRYIATRHLMSTRDRSLIFSLGISFMLHMAAEGYVLSVGSVLCLLFWMYIGWVNDRITDTADVIHARSPLRPRLA